ncbi:hypothetical protein F5B22DRAFT_590475 [Xylaria bambusicola]|uniref:uncharacterized protein n=1 Tax=Xylaria bambusicola TaxID=326684 RepID=UPI002008938E|nr:uncharacterized protein F5B22DRAFT_590475 [Xylaria bambusicola]KAI0525563.1 hypothetical protein F5B22DRAFT_590475 [Xylaria bambusicola]
MHTALIELLRALLLSLHPYRERMPHKATHHRKPPNRSRSRHRHRYGNSHDDACHCSDKGRNSVSEVDIQSYHDAGQDLAPKLFPWSDPVVDTHSSRFQYQARLTPDGNYQWSISGSDSGTNPHYLLSTPSSNMVYPTAPYVVQRPMQNEAQYYDSVNIGTGPATPLNNEGEGDCTSQDCCTDKVPRDDKGKSRRNETSNIHHNEKGDEERRRVTRSRSRQRDRSSYRRNYHHYRSKSHEDKYYQRHRHGSQEKVSDWLYDYGYGYVH